MKTYNTNPGYEMDPQLLTHFNQHLDSLFGIYSKLCKRTARAVLTGMCYSAGSAMRHGSSS
ncbi:hypothetical protein C9Z41_25285, partial [Escherichia coli]